MELPANRSYSFARSRPVIECAQCGEHLFVPEWSEYLEDRRAKPKLHDGYYADAHLGWYVLGDQL